MEEFINKLTSVGLSEYEAKTYYALLQKSGLSATELSKISGVPRTRIYEVLNNLKVKGFCTEFFDKVKKFKAISPQFAFTDLIENYEKEMAKKRNSIEELSKELLPIYEKEKNHDFDLDYIEIISERNHVLEKINIIGDNTKSEILTMNKPPYAVNFERAVKRGSVEYVKGIKYKFITEQTDLEIPGLLEFLQMWERIGAEIRIVEEVPVKLIIFDKKTVLFSLPEKVSSIQKYTSMIIDHEDFAKMYVKIFNMYFNEGITLSEFARKK